MMRKGSSYVRLIAGLTGSLGSGLVAQVGPLNPTASTVIHVPAGGLHYSSINIPAGVVVNFMEIGGAGVLPAVIRCDGDAVVDGTLSASAELLRRARGPAPRATTTSAGSRGSVTTCRKAPSISRDKLIRTEV